MRHLARILTVTTLLAAALTVPLAGPAAADAGAGIGAPGGSIAAPYDCTRLDVGLYWYDKNGDSRKAYADGRSIRGFYSTGKKTVIYAHGAQPDSMGPDNVYLQAPDISFGREKFFWPPSDGIQEGTWTADAWFDAGYNVGIFHWTQLADDTGDAFSSPPNAARPVRAEMKIWATKSASHPDWSMRYRRCDGTLTTSGTTGRTVGQLYYDSYKQALAKYTAAEVRLVGHSLGNQVTMAMAAKAYADTGLSSGKRPKRIALVDPYWSPGGKDYLGGDTTAQRVNGIAATLKAKGVALEWTKTSLLTTYPAGDTNDALVPIISRTDVYPNWLGGADQVSRHGDAAQLYFWSFGAPPAPECTYDLATRACPQNGRQALSAASPTDWVKTQMSTGRIRHQYDGTTTRNPADDTFYPEPWSPPTLLGPVDRATTVAPTLLWTRAPDARNAQLQLQVVAPGGTVVEDRTASCVAAAGAPCESPFLGVPSRTFPAGPGRWTFRARTVGFGGSASDWRTVSFAPLIDQSTPAFAVPQPDQAYDVTADGHFTVTIPSSWKADGTGLRVVFSPETDPDRTYTWEYYRGIPADPTTVPGLQVVDARLQPDLPLPFRAQRVTMTVQPYSIATGAADSRSMSVTYYQP